MQVFVLLHHIKGRAEVRTLNGRLSQGSLAIAIHVVGTYDPTFNIATVEWYVPELMQEEETYSSCMLITKLQSM